MNNFKALVLLWFVSTLLASVCADSAHQNYDWTVSFSTRAPLGVEKQVIVINDQFPGPLLNATTNDVVNINIHNDLTEPFLMTWNGLQMRKNSWQDGVQGTNCPILPGKNWTYSFQLKDQIGSFFYYPSLLLQKASGGYGAIRVNNRDVIPIPFQQPHGDYDILIGDWYNSDYRQLRNSLDQGRNLALPDGILFNGLGPRQAVFNFEPDTTYRLRISNVGSKLSVNFRIQDHELLLVETEGSYTVKQHFSSLDIHVGQSYSVIVRTKSLKDAIGKSFYMVASSRFTIFDVIGTGTINYPGSNGVPVGPLPAGPFPDYEFSREQAQSIRWDLLVGAARPNPQGSYHYGSINVSRTLVLANDMMLVGNRMRFTVNGVSFVYSDTPLKLADFYQIEDAFQPGVIPDSPTEYGLPRFGTIVIDATYRDYYHIVFQNSLPELQTWHLDGYNFFVVGMGQGIWNENMTGTYNMIDAVSRSTVQVYPWSWTAITVMMDNRGMWNLRSQDAERLYLGQELYVRVKGEGKEDPTAINIRDEFSIPENVILCGRVA